MTSLGLLINGISWRLEALQSVALRSLSSENEVTLLEQAFVFVQVDALPVSG